MSILENDINSIINDITQQSIKQFEKVQTRLIYQEIIMIYESNLPYEEYYRQIIEHNEKARKNNFTFNPDKLVIEYIPEKILISKDDFDYIRGLWNTNLIKRYKNNWR